MAKPIVLPAKDQVSDSNPGALREDRIIKYVTFFGDSAIPEDGDDYKRIWETAKLLAQNGYGVVNGGGPGVMKAATDGAESVGGHTTAVYWEPKLASIFEGKNVTNVTDEAESFSNYMMRTLGLIEKAQVFVVCIGGTGTISEFGMVWALAKLYFGKHKPVILYGDFWPKLIKTFQETMLLDDKELGVLNYAETKEDVLELVESFEAEMQTRTKRVYDGDESAFVVSSGVHHTRATYDNVARDYHRERAGTLVSKDQLDEFIEEINPPATVLDIGCGPGYDTAYLAEKFTVVAMDNSKEMVEIARFENPDCDIRHADILTVELPGDEYKGIWARDILHHISDNDIDHVFNKLTKALRSGGVIQIIVREGEGEVVEEEVRGDHVLKRFYHLFTDTELIDRATKAGLELQKMEKTQRSHEWLNAIFRKP